MSILIKLGPIIMLFAKSCQNATERKANCVDDGICQANAIGSHKNSSKLPRNPWWHKPAPMTWPSRALEIHPRCTIEENKNEDMTNPPAPRLLSLKQSKPIHYRGIYKLILGSHMNHCVMPCLHANQSWTDPQMPGSPCHLDQSSFPISHGSNSTLSLAINVTPPIEYKLITSHQCNLGHRPRSTPLCWCKPSANGMLMNCRPTSLCQLKYAISFISKGSWCTTSLNKNIAPSIGYQLMISCRSILWEGSDA